MNVTVFSVSPRRLAVAARRTGQRLQRLLGLVPVLPAVAAPGPPTPVPANRFAELTVERFFETPYQVARVDDPDGDIALIAVYGEIGDHAVVQLHESLADLDRGCYVHLDLSSSSIRTNDAMRSLETIADDLEWRGVVLRVVGLDPQHPMLSPSL